MLRQLPRQELANILANSLKKGGDTAMETQKTLYRSGDDAFDRRLDRMYKSLQELDLMLERQRTQRPPLETRVIYQPVFYPQTAWGNKRPPVLMFPFNVLDRAVERFVKTVVARQIGRMQRFLGLTKR